MRTAKDFFVILVWSLIVVDASRVTTLYTIKNFEFWFNDKYFKDTVAFYRPVSGKWGRIYVNLTVAEPFKDFWIDFKTYRQNADEGNTFQPMNIAFSFNVCDLVKDESPNILFQMVVGVEKFVRDLLSKCPIERGTMIIVPDQIRPNVPRKGQVPVIPSGFYKFTCDFRSTEPEVILAKVAVKFQYKGFW